MYDKSQESAYRFGGSETGQRRKLSFSNGNLDDPSHLEYLYTQCCAQVLKGLHPVARETAVKLAAISCFIEYGPYNPSVENSISAENLMPKEYAKAKELEKNIMQEYKELMFDNKASAKKMYCTICKNSSTYGSVFFLVKERESPSERRLTRRLFGINKDCVMSVDRKSKIVLKSWPLEQIRRWAASPTTFNIDFGDYTEGYYSVQTTEGEKIKKILGNYVDIILKKSQIVDHKGIEGDEGGIMIENFIPSARSLPFMVENGQISWRQSMTSSGVMSGKPLDPFVEGYENERENTGRPMFSNQNMGEEQGDILQGQRQGGMINTVITTNEVYYTNGYGHGQAQSKPTSDDGLAGAIEGVLLTAENTQRSVNQPLGPIQLPQVVGRTAEEQVLWLFEVGGQSIREHLGVLVATIAQIIEWTSVTSPTTDQHITEAIVATGPTLTDLSACVRELSAIIPDKRLAAELLQRTHKFCDVFSLFLEKLHPENNSKRSALLSAASLVGETACGLVHATQGQKRDETKMFYGLLNDRIQNIATSTANLVLQAKTIHGICPEVSAKDKFVKAATKVASSTSELIALARVLALIVSHPACQERVVEAVQQVAFAVDEMLESGSACKSNSLPDQQRVYENL